MFEYTSNDGHKIIVGENVKENHELSSSISSNFLWLHVADYPGCHIIINSESPDTIKDASVLAVYHSKAKNIFKINVTVSKSEDVDVGKVTGTVFVGKVFRTKTIFINKEKSRIERLLKTRVHIK